MINRKALVARHSPRLGGIDISSPLTVGNGDFAFTADITGFQTLYDEYSVFPLCTMSLWGWHTAPINSRFYTLDDLVMTLYNIDGKEYKYASLPEPGNEEIYHWLRHNPHRLNLARIALLWDKKTIRAEDLSDINQELDLYSGVIFSNFTLYGEHVSVQTACDKTSDSLGFKITASSHCLEHLSVCISFPYGSHLISASDWESQDLHTTVISSPCKNEYLAERRLDNDKYFVLLGGVDKINQIEAHRFEIKSNAFSVSFSQEKPTQDKPIARSADEIIKESTSAWCDFWENGGVVDFSAAKDPRAHELERRVVLSQYLTAVQCSGSMPPQETGLSCNSWYGKFHLEMHIIHAGWFPLWQRSELLIKSIPWYKKILSKAKENAARNNFEGARWPKMVGPEGVDSPSWIAAFLIWQQVHIIYLLELIRNALPENEQAGFINDNKELVEETAKFMRSFMRENKKTGCYELPPPLIPAQEEFKPETTQSPVFELSYWKFGLELAKKWMQGDESHTEKRISLPVQDGLYPAHQNCNDTFTSFNRDHPSMLYAYGFIPNDEIDTKIMSDTADKVLKCWDISTLWGWDFALIAMTLTRLGRPEAAVEILLKDTQKNSYTVSGNNLQKGRSDLPLYLPGNGALLLALAMMLEGYGETRGQAGFPKNGMWDGIITEGILPLPY